MSLQYDTSQVIPGPDRLLHEVFRRRNRRLIPKILTGARQTRSERLLGCVLGLAVGDILGCPVEGMSFREIRSRYGAVEGLLSPPYGRHWRLPGLHSDDTQQALAILAALQRAQSPGSDPVTTIGAELTGIYLSGMTADVPGRFGCWRGTGRGFRRVVTRLGQHRGAPDWPYGCAEPSAGLGAVMRIPPLGLVTDDLTTMAQLVAQVTRITHSDDRATVSACAIAFACHLLSQKDPSTFPPKRWLHQLHRSVEQVEQTLDRSSATIGQSGALANLRSESESLFPKQNSALIALVETLIDEPPGSAIRQIAARTLELTGQEIAPTRGFAPSGIAACLYFFLHDIRHPRKALLAAINAGGDTDTIGAIVGALCGALHGPTAFEPFLPDVIALDLIADQFERTVNTEPDSPIDLVEEECFFTTLEENTRALLRRFG